MRFVYVIVFAVCMHGLHGFFSGFLCTTSPFNKVIYKIHHDKKT